MKKLCSESMGELHLVFKDRYYFKKIFILFQQNFFIIFEIHQLIYILFGTLDLDSNSDKNKFQ